jgi:hypothetical protein
MIPENLDRLTIPTNYQTDFLIKREIRALELKMHEANGTIRKAFEVKASALKEFQQTWDQYLIETTIHEVNQLQAYRNRMYQDYVLALGTGKPVNQMDARSINAIVMNTDRRIAIMLRAAQNFAADKGWVLEVQHCGEELKPVFHEVGKVYKREEFNLYQVPQLPKLEGA